MWCIWQEWNNWHFEDLEKTVSDFKLFFFNTILDWAAMLGCHSFISVHDLFYVHGFLDYCSLCS